LGRMTQFYFCLYWTHQTWITLYFHSQKCLSIVWRLEDKLFMIAIVPVLFICSFLLFWCDTWLPAILFSSQLFFVQMWSSMDIVNTINYILRVHLYRVCLGLRLMYLMVWREDIHSDNLAWLTSKIDISDFENLFDTQDAQRDTIPV
jgi:hypothetical protein